MSSTEALRLDPVVVAALYAEHADELCRFLTGVLRDAEAAQEVTQAAFVTAVERGHTADEACLKGWLFRVGFHEALAYRRRQAGSVRAVRKLAERGIAGQLTAEATFLRAELVNQVRQALHDLPELQQVVVRKRIYDEKTFAVIADELHVPLGTVLTRMRLALEKLRRTLQSEKRA